MHLAWLTGTRVGAHLVRVRVDQWLEHAVGVEEARGRAGRFQEVLVVVGKLGGRG